MRPKYEYVLELLFIGMILISASAILTSCAGFHPIAECKAMCKSGQVASYKDEVVECVCVANDNHK